MALRDNVGYWLLADTAEAVEWRATAPVCELAAHLQRHFEIRGKSMSELVFNNSGYMIKGDGLVTSHVTDANGAPIRTAVDFAAQGEMALWRLLQVLVTAFGGEVSDLGLVTPDGGNGAAEDGTVFWEDVINAINERVEARPQERNPDTGERVTSNAAGGELIELPMPTKEQAEQARLDVVANAQEQARGHMLIEDAAAIAPTTNVDEGDLIEAPMPEVNRS